MEEWDIPTHLHTTSVSTERQEFELSLLRGLKCEPDIPVLGVCLGMQWMSLLAGGSIEQDLAEPFATNHKDSSHQITGSFGDGLVHSHHHQAITNAGSLDVIATANDGVIEAVRDANRRWYIGVQWHPERTENNNLGQDLFLQLIHECSKLQATPS
jgi:putative glutamine amidotransferase